MVSDVPFGVLLSGGVDSSMNVALMSELMDRPVTTFTIGYEGKEDYNEFQFARRISQRYRTDHHETLINRDEMQEFLPLLVRLQDEPIADNVCIPLYFLAKLVKDSGTHRGAGRRRRRREFPRLLVVRALPAAGRIGVSAGTAAPAVVAPAGAGAEPAARRAVERGARGPAARAPRRRAVLGRRRLLVGREAATADAGCRAVPRRRSTVPVRGARARRPPRRSTATPSSANTSAPLDGRLDEPALLQKMPVPGNEAPAVRAPADARRQADDGACDRGAGAVSRSRRRRLRDPAAAVLQAARRRRQAHPEDRPRRRISTTT